MIIKRDCSLDVFTHQSHHLKFQEKICYISFASHHFQEEILVISIQEFPCIPFSWVTLLLIHNIMDFSLNSCYSHFSCFNYADGLFLSCSSPSDMWSPFLINFIFIIFRYNKLLLIISISGVSIDVLHWLNRKRSRRTFSNNWTLQSMKNARTCPTWHTLTMPLSFIILRRDTSRSSFMWVKQMKL